VNQRRGSDEKQREKEGKHLPRRDSFDDHVGKKVIKKKNGRKSEPSAQKRIRSESDEKVVGNTKRTWFARLERRSFLGPSI